MTQPKETAMDTNEKARDTASADIIELGVASVETRGGGTLDGEILGNMPGEGISEG
ncbi:benenodin family lasso peptide [Pseudoxanthomonas winnipegensis]|jgi:hypothetical protein|uniref:Benenodin family lasso peptide n=1 Tax=Pseudoxanthomonas winnipegensis TaxID=2480810 RepID=A0ABY1WAX2_9GAMM|nr:benenodin family lasso peptide [Pseudoxanthomonas winnipegensis]TAA07638.1 benenodin family lasso peptide [Pseudoxanthomonas winnipegensis]TAA17664.1 benenodin family lasso peptide [Pseudoxanthomonas winnipegensis]TAH71383.1 benenodin family lasso peptide [Pseudoxanthomonas winnipegensis]